MGKVVLGIDPGFAMTGLAVVRSESPTTAPEVVTLDLVKTEPMKGKAKRDLRVSADDTNRMLAIYTRMSGLVAEFHPNAIAYEVYQPFRAQGGNAWKCARVEGLVLGVGFSQAIMVMPFLPIDLKTKIGRGRSASKEEVEQAVLMRVSNAAEALERFPKTQHEHVADALGYAVLGLAEIWQLVALTGVRY